MWTKKCFWAMFLASMLFLVACTGGSDGGSSGSGANAPAATRHKVTIYPGLKAEVVLAVENGEIVNLVRNGETSKIFMPAAGAAVDNLYFNYQCGWHSSNGSALSAVANPMATTIIANVPVSAQFLISITATNGNEYTLNPDFTDVVLSDGTPVTFDRTAGVYKYGDQSALSVCGGGDVPQPQIIRHHKVTIYPGAKIEFIPAIEEDGNIAHITHLVLNGDGVSKILETSASKAYFNYQCGWHLAGGAALSADYLQGGFASSSGRSTFYSSATTTITGIPVSAQFLISITATNSNEYTLNPDYTDVVLSDGTPVTFDRTAGVYKYGDQSALSTCGGGDTTPPPAQIYHAVSIYDHSMNVVLAVDGDYIIHLVKGGQVASLKKSDAAYVYWNGDSAGWYPSHGDGASVLFPTTTITGTPSHDEGTWYVVAINGTVYSLNLDWVTLSGLPTTRTTDRDLIRY